MSIPESAQYWWDLKDRVRVGNRYMHLLGLDCGHDHNRETDCFEMVTCRACKAIATEEDKQAAKKRAQRREKRRRQRGRKRSENAAQTTANVTCEPCPTCGGQMVVRINRKDKSRFLGCRNYPECRGTRNIET